MRYKLFGRSGLRVSELALGTMTFGEDWGFGASKEVSKQIFDAYANAGGNFIDTANRYTEGTAEKYVGEFIAADRDHFVLATKYTLYDRRDDPNFSGNHRKNMMRSVETSLKRMSTDYIDIFWLHAWDGTTPVEEILRGLDDLVRSGKIHYIGIADAPAWVISQMNAIADLRGWTAFTGIQVQYSLLDRTPERDLLPMARAFDMAMTAWGALGSGVLTGKYNSAEKVEGRAGGGEIPAEKLAIAQLVVDIAAEVGCTPSQVALNWVRQQPGISIPLIGARKLYQAEDTLACIEHSLSDDQMQRLSEASAIELGFPHDFLLQPSIKDIISGGSFNQLDNHRAL